MSSGNSVKHNGKLYVTTLKHCLHHNDTLSDKFVLTWQKKELQNSNILYDVSEAEIEIFGFALEFSDKQVELGSFVCGV